MARAIAPLPDSQPSVKVNATQPTITASADAEHVALVIGLFGTEGQPADET
jgi:hypothetical protein